MTIAAGDCVARTKPGKERLSVNPGNIRNGPGGWRFSALPQDSGFCGCGHIVFFAPSPFDTSPFLKPEYPVWIRHTYIGQKHTHTHIERRGKKPLDLEKQAFWQTPLKIAAISKIWKTHFVELFVCHAWRKEIGNEKKSRRAFLFLPGEIYIIHSCAKNQRATYSVQFHTTAENWGKNRTFSPRRKLRWHIL